MSKLSRSFGPPPSPRVTILLPCDEPPQAVTHVSIDIVLPPNIFHLYVNSSDPMSLMMLFEKTRRQHHGGGNTEVCKTGGGQSHHLKRGMRDVRGSTRCSESGSM